MIFVCRFLRCWCFLVLFAGAGFISAQSIPNIPHPLPPNTPPWLKDFQVRWPVRVVGTASQLEKSRTVLVSLPTGGWLKPDQSDLAVQGASGNLLPFVVLSHSLQGETILQFQREGNENWYWVYGVNPHQKKPLAQADPKKDETFQEGTFFEVREWEGTSTKSWAEVRQGLEKSPRILANGIVSELAQNSNPARPDDASKFIVSYRGFLKAYYPGVFRFLINAEGASFLFVNGFKVIDRPGTNKRFSPKMKVGEIDQLASKVELTEGVHPFEVHQVIDEQPGALGNMGVAVSPPEEKKFQLLALKSEVIPLYARTAAVEFAPRASGILFSHGTDDFIDVAGLKLFLVRFEAQGQVPDETKIVWNMGDGTRRTGRSIVHCYFREGDYEVSIAGGSLPPFQRLIHIWPEPGEMSPLSLDRAVRSLEQMDWKNLEPGRVREIFTFLQTCEQKNRWPVLEQVAQFLLEQKDLDLDTRSQLYAARIEALMKQGKAAEAVRLGEQALPEFAKTPAPAMRVQLATAAVHQYHFKDFAAAGKMYRQLIEDNLRIEHPNLRLAGIRWGDLFAEAGDVAKASETYRLAATLGGDKFAATGISDATRGATLRIAEQKLKNGEILACRQLLQKLEMEFPGRRLDGLYCFLRAESDRFSGRYDEAIRHYEMIFRLPQWAGYKDRATLGLADAHLRLNELAKAKEWFLVLGESFPKVFDANKGAEQIKLIDRRLERAKATGQDDPTQELFFRFEPDDEDSWGDLTAFAMVRATGFPGDHAMFIEQINPVNILDWGFRKKNLVPGGVYWFEFWYKELVRLPPPAGFKLPYAAVYVGKSEDKGDTHQLNIPLHQSPENHWHKTGAKIRLPLDTDFRFRLKFHFLPGPILIDRPSLQLITDHHQDAQVNFLESTKNP